MIDPMRHRKPGFIGLSWRAHRVLDMLNCVSENFKLSGKLPPEFWFSGFLVSEFGMKISDVGDDPSVWISNGLAELIEFGTIEKLAGDDASIIIPGASKSKKPKSASIMKMSPDNFFASRVWNNVADANGLSLVLAVSPTRLAHIQTLASQWNEDEVSRAIGMVVKSDFLKGKNDRGWKADFDWFIRPGTIAKILEGKYTNKGATEVKLINPTKDLYGA